MSVLCTVFLGDDQLAAKFSGKDVSSSDLVDLKSMTDLEFCTLWAILQGREWDVAMLDAFRCVRPATDDEQVVHRFPDDLVSRLADLADAEESEFESIVDRWAETDEMNCSSTEARGIVDEVASLAWRARDEGRGMYVWTST